MWFWGFMLVTVLLIPLTMVGFGRLFMRGAPKEINAAFGYRTAMSMKNRATWEFAHQYCGRLWNLCGLVLLPASVIAMLFVLGQDIPAVGKAGGIVCGIQVVIMLGTIWPVEAALKKNFDRNGKRR